MRWNFIVSTASNEGILTFLSQPRDIDGRNTLVVAFERAWMIEVFAKGVSVFCFFLLRRYEVLKDEREGSGIKLEKISDSSGKIFFQI